MHDAKLSHTFVHVTHVWKREKKIRMQLSQFEIEIEKIDNGMGTRYWFIRIMLLKNIFHNSVENGRINMQKPFMCLAYHAVIAEPIYLFLALFTLLSYVLFIVANRDSP